MFNAFKLCSFFFIAIKTYKLSVCSLFSLVLLVTQKKKNARDRPVNSYLYVVKSHDFVNVNKNVQKKKLSVVYKQEFNECSLKEKKTSIVLIYFKMTNRILISIENTFLDFK
jgi:hypothetical protein